MRGNDLSSLNDFRFKSLDSGVISNVVSIHYYVDNEQVGFIHYTKFPLFSYYVVHSFYIHPHYRRKRYGTQLLHYACNYLSVIGAQKIYVQPGPYELSGNKENGIEAFSQANLDQLIVFYKKMGFDIVDKYTSVCAYILYKIIGINENPQYLMVKNLQR